MILSRTPFRVSLFGGGTDHPAHYERHGGAVLGFALNRYCHVMVRRLPPFFNHRHRIVYSKIELVQRASEIQHPVVRAVLTEFEDLPSDEGLEIHHDGDLPAHAGLGSSSSFTVGLINAIRTLYGSEPPPGRLVTEAIHTERVLVGDAVGDQDQVFAAFGGFLRVGFGPGKTRAIRHVHVSEERMNELLSHLMLVYTGTSRMGSEIARAQVNNAPANSWLLDQMTELVDTAEIALTGSSSITAIGELLDVAWGYKRGLATGITTSEVDDLYERSRAAGAIGGKLLGAGGGGFVLLFVEPDKRAQVQKVMPTGTVEVPVGISHHGSRIVLNDPNGGHVTF